MPFDRATACLLLKSGTVELTPESKRTLAAFLTLLSPVAQRAELQVTLSRTVVGTNLQDIQQPPFLSDPQGVYFTGSGEDKSGRFYWAEGRHYEGATARILISKMLDPQLAEAQTISFSELHDTDPADCELRLEAEGPIGPPPFLDFRFYNCTPEGCQRVPRNPLPTPKLPAPAAPPRPPATALSASRQSTADAYDDMTESLAVIQLDEVLAERRDDTYRVLHRGTEQVDSWLDTNFSMDFHPFCFHCPPLNQAAQRAESSAIFSSLAAHHEAPRDQFQLAMSYLGGLGVERDPSEGVIWLKRAAAAGYWRAEHDLAELFEAGVIVPEDESQAIRLYEAMTRGPYLAGLAMHRLGQIYEFGTGVAQDLGKALDWLMRAEQEYDRTVRANPLAFRASAGEDIGAMYAQGKAVQRDYRLAAQWFLKATDNGQGYGGAHPIAQCALAIMYAGGLGVEKDPKRAAFWSNRPNTRTFGACREM